MGKPSAKQRVLAALQAGPQTTASLCQPDCGGVRFGARILELRDEGHTIIERRLRAGSSQYILTGLRSVSAADATAPAPNGTLAQAASRPHSPAVSVGRGDNPWRRAWLCPRCAYRETSGPECGRGHQAVKAWTGDFTEAAAKRAAA